MNKVVSSIAHDVIVGGIGAIARIVFGGGNVGTATAGVAGGLAGNIIYNEAFPKDRPLGQDKNPLDPNSPNYKKNEQNSTTQESLIGKTTTNTNLDPRYDDQTDLNKLGSNVIKDGIVGGFHLLNVVQQTAIN